MRVIGGEFRSRRLKSVPGLDVRPTSDRLRETLFNILAPGIAGKVFLDAYAGTGAVGIEALSRGAARCIFIERNPDALRVLRDNLCSLGIGPERAQVVAAKAGSAAARHEADIVFADPPYRLEQEYQLVLHSLGEHPPDLVIVQHSVRVPLAGEYGRLRRRRQLRQGDNILSFFAPEA
ncbi:MAG: 16S rRNA (guanine(966)-N(2))-methyltransferase RsmD [Acidobacteria bacterium]|nr:16S rRNA (guanine(966)-N(2))-methyltransferase RsmD [Acidobacteriota bacterium]